ncbi:ribonuclease III [Clostridium thermobutyricum]|uniref:Ribonuclease 3 n=2 Tax=Clostridium thermobutyricum TaxID=29372 RepID=N9WFX5_9CLOT|nr:ribonuclease III [Clostridium thermobutyricum]ENZ01760.1 ribonuclease 3 [Clostridium thermobutyricum]OPX51257.1 ribonuclease 3 [Clostridium thermobutyricum DSM 4928]
MNKLKLKEMEASLGVTFTNLSYLRVALTHSSFANQYKDSEYNERLEFLGDSVLQLSVTEYLYKNYKEKSEGELTKIRSLIVCENSLYEVAKSVNIGAYIRMSRGEELTGGRNRVSIQADAIEAVIAAIYLDKGFEYAREFILNKFHDIIDKAINNKIILDFKTKLQEHLQQNGEVNITYELVKFEGPPHRRKFYTRVLINKEVMGEGEGYSKKEAEQKSAKQALINLEVINE